MDNRVFICYSRKDEDFVLKLATNLKRQGVPIWLDQWDIPAGANWNRTIEKALNECTRLLLVLSPSSVESDEVQCEWLSALDEKKIVVPILYKPCRMPFRLKPIQYIDFVSRSPDDIAALNDVLVALGKARKDFIKICPEIPMPKEKLSGLRQHIRNKRNAMAWYNKGIALFDQKKYDEALKAYDEAIKLIPTMPRPGTTKPMLSVCQKKYDEAIKAYDEAIRLNPKYACLE